MNLPRKWLKPKHARCLNREYDAWWYGEKNGIHVCIQNHLPGMTPHAIIPRHMILKWADDIRKKPPARPTR